MAAKLALQLKKNPAAQTSLKGEELLEACIGHEDFAKYLIRFKNYDINWTDDTYGNSILHHLVYCNHVSMIQFLIDNRASIDLKNANGATPLHWAAMLNHLESAEVLLRAKASLDNVDLSGSTPLHLASDCGHPEMVQIFLRSPGAASVISLRDKDNCTAIELAFQKKTENHKASYVLLKRFYRSNNISLPKLVGSGTATSAAESAGEILYNNTSIRQSNNEGSLSRPSTATSRPVSASQSHINSTNNGRGQITNSQKNGPNYNRANEFYSQNFPISSSYSPSRANFDSNNNQSLTNISVEESSSYLISRNNSRVLSVNNDKQINNLSSMQSPLGRSFGDQSEFDNMNEDDLYFFQRTKPHKSMDFTNNTINSNLVTSSLKASPNKRPFFIRSLSSTIDLLDVSAEKPPPSPDKISFPPIEKIDLVEELQKQLTEEYNNRPLNVNYLKSGRPAKSKPKPRVRNWQNWIRHVRTEFEPAHYTPWTPTTAQHLDVVVTVEHCCDCSNHTWSLWHNSGKYRNIADECLQVTLDALQELNLPIRVFAMKVKPEPSRVGALEVTVNIRLHQNETALVFDSNSNDSETVKKTKDKGPEPKINEREWISHTLHSKLDSLSWPVIADIRRTASEFVSSTLKPIIYMSSLESVKPDMNSIEKQKKEYYLRTAATKPNDKECYDIVETTNKIYITGRILDLGSIREAAERDGLQVDKLEVNMLEHFLVFDWKSAMAVDNPIVDMAETDAKPVDMVEAPVSASAEVKEIEIVDPVVQADNETDQFEIKKVKVKNLLDILGSDINFGD